MTIPFPPGQELNKENMKRYGKAMKRLDMKNWSKKDDEEKTSKYIKERFGNVIKRLSDE